MGLCLDTQRGALDAFRKLDPRAKADLKVRCCGRGRWLAEDRTERPVGAQITLEIWRRLQQNRSTSAVLKPPNNTKLTWLLDLLYEDLRDWQEWLWTSRRLPPLLLGGMGSDPCFIPPPLVGDHLARSSQEQQLWCKKSWGMGQLQGARFEYIAKTTKNCRPNN